MPQLAEIPSGKELEDFVAALLQCTGHFLEKNVEEPNVLELDIVATKYADGGPSRRLFEVKEGPAQFSDIFKVLGWMTYLGIDQGAFVTARSPESRPLEFFTSRCEQVGMKFVLIEDHTTAAQVFEAAGFGAADERLHAIWRYSMWVERNLIRGLRLYAARHPEMQAPREALNYYKLINNGIFMTSDAVERVEKLYAAFQEHPRLTAAAAQELGGGLFDPETTQTASPQMREALFQGRHVLLQACMYLEHRARLSLLKATIDYLAGGGPVRDNGDGTFRVDFRITDLPHSFADGLGQIGRQPHHKLYPSFWQTFLWGWGGLVITDRLQDDYAGLSEQTGIPVSDIPTAMRAFDLLFPTPNGWLRGVANTSYSLITMVPAPFQGLGAWQRLLRSGLDEYPQLELSGQYTTQDLIRRHNQLVSLLNDNLDF
jgi:hypothetical protein